MENTVTLIVHIINKLFDEELDIIKILTDIQIYSFDFLIKYVQK